MQDQSRNIPFIGRLEPRPIPTTALEFRGRHRKLAELTRLEHEIRLLTEELDELERVPKVSSACIEVYLLVLRENKIPFFLAPLVQKTLNGIAGSREIKSLKAAVVAYDDFQYQVFLEKLNSLVECLYNSESEEVCLFCIPTDDFVCF